ncbi:hypothetical protein PBCV1_a066L [Paramecium bursaria Chlorella virus 1]|uniref:Uncharacterized protein n=1 Tax=Paramecium bursaria Chlorella virus 1 TaxID=10506 RepID=Q89401_PBCV1|nr:hypothetical protein PBCV1_a066L [Paramecium bursaria Chlorella virus 1]AAC96434.1 hypothetical protein [Paramecium bursaria Chlorella virus 1]
MTFSLGKMTFSLGKMTLHFNFSHTAILVYSHISYQTRTRYRRTDSSQILNRNLEHNVAYLVGFHLPEFLTILNEVYPLRSKHHHPSIECDRVVRIVPCFLAYEVRRQSQSQT